MIRRCVSYGVSCMSAIRFTLNDYIARSKPATLESIACTRCPDECDIRRLGRLWWLAKKKEEKEEEEEEDQQDRQRRKSLDLSLCVFTWRQVMFSWQQRDACCPFVVHCVGGVRLSGESQRLFILGRRCLVRREERKRERERERIPIEDCEDNFLVR